MYPATLHIGFLPLSPLYKTSPLRKYPPTQNTRTNLPRNGHFFSFLFHLPLHMLISLDQTVYITVGPATIEKNCPTDGLLISNKSYFFFVIQIEGICVCISLVRRSKTSSGRDRKTEPIVRARVPSLRNASRNEGLETGEREKVL